MSKEQKECKGCNYEKEYNEPWQFHACGKIPTSKPLSTGGEEWEEKHYRMTEQALSDFKNEKIGYTQFIDLLAGFIAAEKAKSYQQGQKDKIVEVQKVIDYNFSLPPLHLPE